jgi:hypothetical protein
LARDVLHPTCEALVADEWDYSQGVTKWYIQTRFNRLSMNMLDLVKATVVCGGVAFLIYSFPVVGQILLIGFLSVLWLMYAYKAVEDLRRRWKATR